MNNAWNLPRRGFLRAVGAGAMASYAPLRASQPESPLDQFIHQYMQAMNAPGLTLALANKSGVVRTAGFGYSDVELKTPVTPDLLFEIGSITKSFVALTLLQLRDQGKVDLQKPILDYLPWLPIQANYGVITVHHLLTHSSGLPNALSLFLSDTQARHVQGFKPGEHFHYCNLGFHILGYLIQTLDGRPWPEAVRQRILEPLGMASSRTVITDRTRAQRAQSYVPRFEDVVYLRSGRLAPAGDLVFDDSAGSITATPGDMALYLQMLLNRGRFSQQRLVSEEAFVLFSTPYIKAPEFSPTAFYGYGIGVDKLDGHTVLRHTGGMISFASSMHADLDSGIAAFASINAMQGYRPVPVTQFAVQSLNAASRKTDLPLPPELPNPGIENVLDYTGIYTSSTGDRLEVITQEDKLVLLAAAQVTPLERTDGDVFLANADAWNRFPLVFGRADTPDQAGKTPVVELAYGSALYTNSRYTGIRSYPEPTNLQRFTGFFQGVSNWSGNVRMVLRKGKLWADGINELQPIGNDMFRMGEEPFSPDTAQFCYVVDGKAQMLKLNGADYLRISEQ